MNEKVRAKALDSLDRMAEIVRAEAITRGVYNTEVEAPEREDAICGGRRYCLLGSLWVGYGAKFDDYGDLVGVADIEERAEYLRRRPALRAAFDALNVSASSLMSRRDWPRRYTPDEIGAVSTAEDLFEGHYSDDLSRADLLRLISSAKRRIKAA